MVTEAASTLVTVARDVKLQVAFNPAAVSAYRLIGYENRVLADEDFDDDSKDAGDIGAGHTVTALYEIVPAGAAAAAGDLLTVKLRYKAPEGDTSRLLEVRVAEGAGGDSEDARFAAAVAAFGMLLRGSEYKGEASFGQVLELARAGRGQDQGGTRAEFIRLVETAQALAGS